jgi:hypothetical protein
VSGRFAASAQQNCAKQKYNDDLSTIDPHPPFLLTRPKQDIDKAHAAWQQCPASSKRTECSTAGSYIASITPHTWQTQRSHNAPYMKRALLAVFSLPSPHTLMSVAATPQPCQCCALAQAWCGKRQLAK